MRLSLLLTIIFGGMIISGAMLLTSITVFEELQTPFFVYLGFGLMIVGGCFIVTTAIKQDEIDERCKANGD